MRSIRAITVAAAAALVAAVLVPTTAGADPSPWADGTVFVAETGHNSGLGHLVAIAPDGTPTVLADGTVQDVAVAADGTVYWVTCEGGLFSSAGGFSSDAIATPGGCPTALALEPSGNLLVDSAAGLTGYGPDGTPLGQVSVDTGATGIAVDAQGDIYLATAAGTVKLLPAGGTPTVLDGLFLGATSLVGLRLDAADTLVAGAGSAHGVFVQPPDSAAVQYATDDTTNGVAVGQDGTLYVSDLRGDPDTQDEIDVIPAGGGSVSVLATGLDTPAGLAVYPPATAPARTASSTNLAFSPGTTVNANDVVTLTATVDGGPAGLGGFVQFLNLNPNGPSLGAAVPVTDGVASLQVQLPRGSDPIVATYLGSATEAPSQASRTLTVKGLLSTTTMTAPSTTVAQASPAEVDVAVAGGPGTHGTPSGTVDIYVNKKLVTTVPVDGSGNATVLLHLNAGVSNVNARYSGDGFFNPSAGGNLKITAVAPYAPKLAASWSYGKPNGAGARKVKINVTLTGATGAAAPGGTVSADSGFSCTALALSPTKPQSKATCSATLSLGDSRTVTVSYSGDDSYVPATTMIAVSNV